MRVFVAGATGVVGRRAVPMLLERGHAVTGVARSPEKRAALERAGAAAVKLDLFDPGAVARAVAGHEVVINLATHIPPGMRVFLRRAWRENDRIRRQCAANLARAAAAAGARRFIQESFAPVYPDRGADWIDETVSISPVRYNRSVTDAEGAAEQFTRGGGQGVVLRFGWFYGPDSPQVADMIRYVRKGWAPLPGPAEAYWSSLSHDDAAAAVVAALGVPAGVYNAVDDEPLSRREYFDSLAAALGVEPPRLPPGWAKYLMGSLGSLMARSLRISNRKLRSASAWSPKYRSAREAWPDLLKAIGA